MAVLASVGSRRMLKQERYRSVTRLLIIDPSLDAIGCYITIASDARIGVAKGIRVRMAGCGPADS
jgi:hypothetical protein